MMSEADKLVEALGLQPHPEGGWFKETHRSSEPGRAALTQIYYLLKAGEQSKWHRIDTTEIWHFYRGAPLILGVSEDGKRARSITLGPKVEEGHQAHMVIPPKVWQAARSTGDYTLVGCTVAPGFEFAGFEMAEFDLPF